MAENKLKQGPYNNGITHAVSSHFHLLPLEGATSYNHAFVMRQPVKILLPFFIRFSLAFNFNLHFQQQKKPIWISNVFICLQCMKPQSWWISKFMKLKKTISTIFFVYPVKCILSYQEFIINKLYIPIKCLRRCYLCRKIL